MRKIEDVILRNTEKPQRMALFLVLPLVLGFSILFAVFYWWDTSSRHRLLDIQLKETAKSHLDHILLTRLWNASHSGVYVEMTEETPPNPFLDDPEKIIESTNGKRYTKLNPAYMTRQISELADQHYDFRMHMSSLKPKNPTNSADEWEKAKLLSFQNGATEASGTFKSDGKEYFRYMAPLVVAEDCLTCHGKDGYRIGDIKGGISITVPVDLLSRLHANLDRKSLIAFSTIGIMTMAVLVGVTWISSRKLGEGLRKELESERLTAAVKTAAAAAHELRQPLTVVSGFSELLKERLRQGEDIAIEANIIISQCERMNEIISRMLNVTVYRTKTFGEETEIFDLGVQPTADVTSLESRLKD